MAKAASLARALTVAAPVPARYDPAGAPDVEKALVETQPLPTEIAESLAVKS